MWSLGCLAAALLVGTLLYSGRSDYDIVRASSARGVMFAANVVEEQRHWMFPALFLDAADRPNAGLPIKPAALCGNHDWTVF